MATSEEGAAFIEQAFRDAISWKAAAILLKRVLTDPAFGELDPEVRAAVERFLDSHPAPADSPLTE